MNRETLIRASKLIGLVGLQTDPATLDFMLAVINLVNEKGDEPISDKEIEAIADNVTDHWEVKEKKNA